MSELGSVVMAHPKREAWAISLARELDCPIVWDTVNDVWETGRRALLAYDPDATHHLVIQDDAILAVGMLEACRAIVAQYPDQPISLYAGLRYKKIVRECREEGRRYLQADGPWWGVGVISPVKHIEAMVDHGDGLPISNYDLRMMDYWRSLGVQCVYPMPSIVNHRGIHENPSLVSRKRDKTRRAIWFTDNAGEYEW